MVYPPGNLTRSRPWEAEDMRWHQVPQVESLNLSYVNAVKYLFSNIGGTCGTYQKITPLDIGFVCRVLFEDAAKIGIWYLYTYHEVLREVYITFFNQMVVKDSKGTLACLPASPRVLELSLSFAWSIIVSFVRHRANLNLHWRLAASCSRRPALKFLNWIL